MRREARIKGLWPAIVFRSGILVASLIKARNVIMCTKQSGSSNSAGPLTLSLGFQVGQLRVSADHKRVITTGPSPSLLLGYVSPDGTDRDHTILQQVMAGIYFLALSLALASGAPFKGDQDRVAGNRSIGFRPDGSAEHRVSARFHPRRRGLQMSMLKKVQMRPAAALAS